MKYLEDIKNDYANGEYKNKLEYPTKSKYKEGHIFDENQTVKWNRNMVVRQNELIENDKKVYYTETNRLNKKLHEDAVKAIMNESKFNKAQAEKIWEYAYAEKHSYMNDVFNFVEELINLIEQIIRLK